ncbi:hypothetical protein Goarm_004863 [Gossypium armourianum]|uniref:Uncharacterized protein n=1 Tax=Gossypium armourianum TaxID=34283 RepID=A0A7J9JY34_9ROSI|nr:hypothetical protein [Gossypium armourianum]
MKENLRPPEESYVKINFDTVFDKQQKKSCTGIRLIRRLMCGLLPLVFLLPSQASGSWISEAEKVEIVLAGLTPEFDAILTLALFSLEPLPLQQLVDVLLEYENRQMRVVQDVPVHANLLENVSSPPLENSVCDVPSLVFGQHHGSTSMALMYSLLRGNVWLSGTPPINQNNRVSNPLFQSAGQFDCGPQFGLGRQCIMRLGALVVGLICQLGLVTLIGLLLIGQWA